MICYLLTEYADKKVSKCEYVGTVVAIYIL